MNLDQTRELLTVLEEENQISTAVSMIDKKDDLAKKLIAHFPSLQQKKVEVNSRSSVVAAQVTGLDKRVKSLGDNQTEYDELVKMVKAIKTEVEVLKQSVRDIQAALKVPLRVVSASDFAEPHRNMQALAGEVAQLSKDLHALFSSVDKSIQELNQKWLERAKSNQPSVSDETEDDSALVLFEAVKMIGNPDAIGNIYRMTWGDIMQSGFRSVEDFKAKGISSLEQLQMFIDKKS